jgi:hypothetical protein
MNIIVDPDCVLQPYLMDDLNTVSKCATFEGYRNAALITVVILFITYFSDGKFDMPVITPRKGLLVLTLILATWILVPPMTINVKKQYWKGYKKQIKKFKQHGFSEKEAIKQLQDLHEKDLEQDFMRSLSKFIPFV